MHSYQLQVECYYYHVLQQSKKYTINRLYCNYTIICNEWYSHVTIITPGIQLAMEEITGISEHHSDNMESLETCLNWLGNPGNL